MRLIDIHCSTLSPAELVLWEVVRPGFLRSAKTVLLGEHHILELVLLKIRACDGNVVVERGRHANCEVFLLLTEKLLSDDLLLLLAHNGRTVGELGNEVIVIQVGTVNIFMVTILASSESHSIINRNLISAVVHTLRNLFVRCGVCIFKHLPLRRNHGAVAHLLLRDSEIAQLLGRLRVSSGVVALVLLAILFGEGREKARVPLQLLSFI